MNNEELRSILKKEEECANISGWDFSHIDGKYVQFDQDLPWSYENTVKSYLQDNLKLLDIDTGGGELLLTYHHPYSMTSATESYPPSVKLCEEKLLPLGIDFHEASNYSSLPFEDDTFDIVLNRHGSYDPVEIKRILKKGGFFITQQVGGQNHYELIKLLCPNSKHKYFDHNLKNELKKFNDAQLNVIKSDECFFNSEFYDLGAIVWFARVLKDDQFIGFSVDSNFNQILEAQELLKKDGKITATCHRFFIIAQKN